MSRIGRKPIPVPSGVEVKLQGTHLTVKGPKGTLERDIHPSMALKIGDGVVEVERPNDERENRALHGLTRALVSNMVIGVTEGFTRNLEIQGVGYRAASKGKGIEFALGYSHSIQFDAPQGITLEVEGTNKITVSGTDKQMVGQVAANIRELRPPEPYKGKGIRYEGERVRRKAGKAAK
jgi:large subunit ribosomal protein L6